MSNQNQSVYQKPNYVKAGFMPSDFGENSKRYLKEDVYQPLSSNSLSLSNQSIKQREAYMPSSLIDFNSLTRTNIGTRKQLFQSYDELPDLCAEAGYMPEDFSANPLSFDFVDPKSNLTDSIIMSNTPAITDVSVTWKYATLTLVGGAGVAALYYGAKHVVRHSPRFSGYRLNYTQMAQYILMRSIKGKRTAELYKFGCLFARNTSKMIPSEIAKPPSAQFWVQAANTCFEQMETIESDMIEQIMDLVGLSMSTIVAYHAQSSKTNLMAKIGVGAGTAYAFGIRNAMQANALVYAINRLKQYISDRDDRREEFVAASGGFFSGTEFDALDTGGLGLLEGFTGDLFVGLGIAGLLGTGLKVKDFIQSNYYADFCSSLNGITMRDAATGKLGWLIKILKVFIEQLMNWAALKFGGYARGSYTTTDGGTYVKYKEQYTALWTRALIDKKVDPLDAPIAKKLFEDVSYLSANMADDSRRLLGNAVSTLEKDCAKLWKKINLFVSYCGKREVPFAVCMVGPPGVGKSTIAVRLGRELCAAHGVDFRLYSRPLTQAFANGCPFWIATHTVSLYDDICNINTNENSGLTDMSSELIGLISGIPFSFDRADLDSKMDGLVAPKFVLATANSMRQVVRMVECKTAMTRRFGAIVNVRVRAEFLVGEPRSNHVEDYMFSKDGKNRFTTFCEQTGNFDHDLYDILEASLVIDKEDGWVQAQWVPYRDMHRKLITMSVAHYKDASRHVNINHSACQEMCEQLEAEFQNPLNDVERPDLDVWIASDQEEEEIQETIVVDMSAESGDTPLYGDAAVAVEARQKEILDAFNPVTEAMRAKDPSDKEYLLKLGCSKKEIEDEDDLVFTKPTTKTLSKTLKKWGLPDEFQEPDRVVNNPLGLVNEAVVEETVFNSNIKTLSAQWDSAKNLSDRVRSHLNMPKLKLDCPMCDEEFTIAEKRWIQFWTKPIEDLVEGQPMLEGEFARRHVALHERELHKAETGQYAILVDVRDRALRQMGFECIEEALSESRLKSFYPIVGVLATTASILGLLYKLGMFTGEEPPEEEEPIDHYGESTGVFTKKVVAKKARNTVPKSVMQGQGGIAPDMTRAEHAIQAARKNLCFITHGEGFTSTVNALYLCEDIVFTSLHSFHQYVQNPDQDFSIMVYHSPISQSMSVEPAQKVMLQMNRDCFWNTDEDWIMFRTNNPRRKFPNIMTQIMQGEQTREKLQSGAYYQTVKLRPAKVQNRTVVSLLYDESFVSTDIIREGDDPKPLQYIYVSKDDGQPHYVFNATTGMLSAGNSQAGDCGSVIVAGQHNPSVQGRIAGFHVSGNKKGQFMHRFFPDNFQSKVDKFIELHPLVVNKYVDRSVASKPVVLREQMVANSGCLPSYQNDETVADMMRRKISIEATKEFERIGQETFTYNSVLATTDHLRNCPKDLYGRQVGIPMDKCPMVYNSPNGVRERTIYNGLFGPEKQRPVDLSKPFGKAVDELRKGDQPIHNVPWDILDVVAKSIAEDNAKSMQFPDNKYPLVLDLDQCINGYKSPDGFIEVAGLSMSKSAGYPMMKAKSETGWFKQQDNGRWKATEEFEEIWSKAVKSIEEGVPIEAFYAGILKDETLPIKDLERGKVRLFCAAPVLLVMLQKRYLGVMLSMLHANHADIDFGVGMNPYGWAWTKLHDDFKESCSKFFTADARRLDKTTSLPSCLAYDIYIRHMFDLLAHKFDANLSWIVAMRAVSTLHYMDSFPKIVIGKFVFQMFGTIPSGCVETTDKACFTTKFHFTASWCEVVGWRTRFDIADDIADMKKAFKGKHTGDDILGGLRKGLDTMPVSLESWVDAIYERHGTSYTSGSDKEKAPYLVDSLTEEGMSYLARAFNPMGEQVYAPLDRPGSMTTHFDWKKKSVPERDAFVSSVYTIIPEALQMPNAEADKVFDKLKYCEWASEYDCYIPEFTDGMKDMLRRQMKEVCEELDDEQHMKEWARLCKNATPESDDDGDVFFAQNGTLLDMDTAIDLSDIINEDMIAEAGEYITPLSRTDENPTMEPLWDPPSADAEELASLIGGERCDNVRQLIKRSSYYGSTGPKLVKVDNLSAGKRACASFDIYPCFRYNENQGIWTYGSWLQMMYRYWRGGMDITIVPKTSTFERDFVSQSTDSKHGMSSLMTATICNYPEPTNELEWKTTSTEVYERTAYGGPGLEEYLGNGLFIQDNKIANNMSLSFPYYNVFPFLGVPHARASGTKTGIVTSCYLKIKNTITASCAADSDLNGLEAWSVPCDVFMAAKDDFQFGYITGIILLEALTTDLTAAQNRMDTDQYAYYGDSVFRAQSGTGSRMQLMQEHAMAAETPSALSTVVSEGVAGVSHIGNAIGAGLKFLGLSKPVAEGTATPIVNNPYFNLSATDCPSSAVSLGLSSNNTLGMHNELFGTTLDDGDFKRIYETNGIIHISKWYTNNAVGSTLHTHAISPTATHIDVVGGMSRVHMSPQALLASCFRYYRYDEVVISVQVVSNAFLKGRLLYMYCPRGDAGLAFSSQDYTNSYIKRHDIEENRTCSISIPWTSPTPVLEVPVPGSAYNTRTMPGTLRITNFTILSSPTTALTEVDLIIRVFYKGMKFYGPTLENTALFHPVPKTGSSSHEISSEPINLDETDLEHYNLPRFRLQQQNVPFFYCGMPVGQAAKLHSNKNLAKGLLIAPASILESSKIQALTQIGDVATARITYPEFRQLVQDRARPVFRAEAGEMIEPIGQSSLPNEGDEIVQTAEEAPAIEAVVQDVQTTPSPYMRNMIASDNAQLLMNALTRPVLAADFTWTGDDNAGTIVKSISIPGEWINNPFIKDKLKNFTFFVCTGFTVRFTFNASPFLFGCLQAVAANGSALDPTTDNENVYAMSAFPNVLITAGSESNQPCAITVPFITPCMMLEITRGEVVDVFGQVLVQVLSPLRATNDAEKQITVQMTLQMHDPVVHIPTRLGVASYTSGETLSARLTGL